MGERRGWTTILPAWVTWSAVHGAARDEDGLDERGIPIR